MPLALGIDFGTGSVRSLALDLESGQEISSAEEAYETLSSAAEPNLARQRPCDHLEAMARSIRGSLRTAIEQGFVADQTVGIGIATTGSTPLPVDRFNQALAMQPAFAENLNAQMWLWKDHTASKEAQEISAVVAEKQPELLALCGGRYSSEWFWAKILRCLRTDRAVFDAADSWIEACDWIGAEICGIKDPLKVKRSACAAGHKALWNGVALPRRNILNALAPALGHLRPRLYNRVYPIGVVAGFLCDQWANELGLPVGVPVSVGALDAHLGAVGAGVREGRLVKILGTSTCDCAVLPKSCFRLIDGISGIAADSILPGYYGLEAGQSAVGDIFDWFVSKVCRSDSSLHAELTAEVEQLAVGQSGLVALDWHNGNRCVLGNSQLSGLMVGQTLNTTRAEVYRALIEATAYGARLIIERMHEAGIEFNAVVCTGGIAGKNAALMQIYADILGCRLEVAGTDLGCALGAAMAGSVAGGFFEDIETAQNALCPAPTATFEPRQSARQEYDELYAIYMKLHDAFGASDQSDLSGLMEQLRGIASRARKSALAEC